MLFLSGAVDAVRVGRACDEQRFDWYEDPYRDGGVSQHAHRKLRGTIQTPLLQTEHARGVEAHTDLIDNDAADFVRRLSSCRRRSSRW